MTAPKNASEVIPRLWQGGAPKPGRYSFDLIVLTAAEYQPASDQFPGSELLRVPLPDDWRGLTADKRAELYASTVAAAEAVADGHRAGKSVLVTCGAGLNRSGLVTGLALRDLGRTADAALELIRKARGTRALAGKAFPAFIRTYQPGASAGETPRPQPQSSLADASVRAAATAAATAAAAAATPQTSKLWRVVAIGTVLAFVGAVVLVSEARR